MSDFRDPTDVAQKMFYAHLDDAHPDDAAYTTDGQSCGEGSWACPLCKWQVFVEVAR